jgi:RNA polymerase sigma-70 factor (ECF subfamily)
MTDVGETIAPRPPHFRLSFFARRAAGLSLEADGLEALVRANEAGLRSLAYRLLGSREEMEDALQEACLKALRAHHQLRTHEPAAAAAWLYRVLYRTCLDRIRQRARPPVEPVDHLDELVEPSRDHADGVAARLELADALARLDPQLRAAVLVVDQLGFDYETAGEILAIPSGTVGSRLNQARRELRTLLGLPPDRITPSQEVTR